MSLKICLAQIKSTIGDVKQNISNHIKWVKIAITNNADLIVFPELSLTGYEPKLAKEVAFFCNDNLLNVFQDLSNLEAITIVIGLPTKMDDDICISMMIFQPFKERKIYSKQLLHIDELPYFIPGKESNIITINNVKIGLAICYESLQKQHIDTAIKQGAELYLVSVAKNENGIKNAMHYFPIVAKQYKIPILMVNNVGINDNFNSFGKTCCWNKKGELIKQLNTTEENYLLCHNKNNKDKTKLI